MTTYNKCIYGVKNVHSIRRSMYREVRVQVERRRPVLNSVSDDDDDDDYDEHMVVITQ